MINKSVGAFEWLDHEFEAGHGGTVGTTLFINEIGQNTENSDISDFASFALKLMSHDWSHNNSF